MRKRSEFFELVLLLGGAALLWLLKIIFDNLFYGVIKQFFERHWGILESEVLAQLSGILPIIGLVALILIGLYRYVYRQLSRERDTEKQAAIDALSDEISWAISNLLNRKPRPLTGYNVEQWKRDFQTWCAKVSNMLADRKFFTHSDQLHFDKLGVVGQTTFMPAPAISHEVTMLDMKIERLRDIIKWRQGG